MVQQRKYEVAVADKLDLRDVFNTNKRLENNEKETALHELMCTCCHFIWFIFLHKYHHVVKDSFSGGYLHRWNFKA